MSYELTMEEIGVKGMVLWPLEISSDKESSESSSGVEPPDEPIFPPESPNPPPNPPPPRRGEGVGISGFGLWGLFWILLAFIALVVFVAVAVATNTGIGLAVGFLVFFLVAIATIVLAWKQVPQQDAWVIEILGEYVGTWEAGLHFLFPYFGLMRVESEVYLGEQQMPLYMDEKVKEGYGKGKVDFTDGSCRVDAVVYFIINDPFLATYNIADVIRGIEDRMDGAIRSYLGSVRIDIANQLKAQFDLGRILNGERPGEDGSFQSESNAHRHWLADPKETPGLWREIYEDWGVQITGVAITDIQLTDEIIAARHKILEAEKLAQAALEIKRAAITEAEGKKQAAIIIAEGAKAGEVLKAEGNKQALELEGEGLASQVRQLGVAGEGKMNPGVAVNFLVRRLLYGILGDKAVIIENTGSIPGIGAQLAAGANSFNQANQAKEKPSARRVNSKNEGE